eukprot:11363119-Alexandrium_andersonii.AAC.1
MEGSERLAARKAGSSSARLARLCSTSASANWAPLRRSWVRDKPTRGAGFGGSVTAAGPGRGRPR